MRGGRRSSKENAKISHFVIMAFTSASSIVHSPSHRALVNSCDDAVVKIRRRPPDALHQPLLQLLLLQPSRSPPPYPRERVPPVDDLLGEHRPRAGQVRGQPTLPTTSLSTDDTRMQIRGGFDIIAPPLAGADGRGRPPLSRKTADQSIASQDILLLVACISSNEERRSREDVRLLIAQPYQVRRSEVYAYVCYSAATPGSDYLR
jgi:hypothetical protein